MRRRALLALILSAPAAFAQESPEEQARQAFQRGVAAMQAGRYPSAIAELEFSYGLLPRCSTQFNLAVAYEQTRRYADSLDVFTRYQSDCASTMPPQNVTYIADASRRLRSHLGVISLRVTPASAVSTVSIDGRSRANWSADLALDPGSHSIEVRSTDGQSVRREVQAGEGAREVVEISLSTPTQAPLRTVDLAPDPYGPETASQGRSGDVRIETPTARAEVTVDGRNRGETPVEARLGNGRHLVEVRADGYVPSRVAVTVRDGALTRLSTRLEREESAAASPFYTRWWFWTLLGAAAIGGAVALTWELTRPVDTPVYTFQAVTSP